MDRTGSRPGLISAVAFCLSLLLGASVVVAGPPTYTLTISPTGDDAVDQALVDASLLAELRDDVPVGAFALISRAETDTARLETVLRSFGYYDSLVDIRIASYAIDDPALLPLLQERARGTPVPVAIAIDTGPLYRLGQVRLDGPVPPRARAVFDLRAGDPARAEPVLAAGAAVLNALLEDGFALAKVPPPDALVDHDTRTMDVVYLADPGPWLTIGPVTVIGLERLRESYVLRRLGLKPGEPFSPSRLEAARAELMAGGALAWARLTPGTAPDAQGRLPLTLEVAERPLRVIRVAGAYSSNEGGTLSTSWTHRNLFGGAERLTLRGDVGELSEGRRNELSYLTEAALTIPDVWLRDLDLRLTLGALSDHPDAFDRDAVTAGAALQRRVSARFSASGGLAYEHSRVAQDGPARDYRLLSLPLTLDYDGSDNLLDPRGGLRLAAQLSPTRVLEGDAQGFVLGRLTASAYLSLDGYPAIGTESASTVLAGRLAVGSIFGAEPDAVPPDWRFYAGGAGSVRGYTYQSIGPRTPSNQPAGGDGLLEGSLELRRHVRANWAMVAFADAGAVSENGIPGAGSLAVGLGLGVRYLTPVGPVRVDLATPLDREIEDSPVQLYIGIGQAF